MNPINPNEEVSLPEEQKKTRKYTKSAKKQSEEGEESLEAPKIKKERKPITQERREQLIINLNKGKEILKTNIELRRIEATKKKEESLLKRAEQLRRRDEQYLKSLGYETEEEDKTTVETNTSIPAPDTKIIKMKKPKKKTIIYKEESDSGSEEEVIIRRRPKKEKKVDTVIEKEKPTVEKTPVIKPTPRIIFA